MVTTWDAGIALPVANMALKSNLLRQADAGGALGGSRLSCCRVPASGPPGLFSWSFFTSPAKPLGTCYKARVQAAAFFLGLPPTICARTLPAHCTNISSSQTSAEQAPLAGPPPSPARLPMEAAPRTPPHMFWSPTQLLSCK